MTTPPVSSIDNDLTVAEILRPLDPPKGQAAEASGAPVTDATEAMAPGLRESHDWRAGLDAIPQNSNPIL